jgi:hypothetical protein
MSHIRLPKVNTKTISIIALGLFFVCHPVRASVANWQKGFSIIPATTTDFSTESFQQSLHNLKSTGANYVTLIIPYYQNTANSTQLFAGANTPSDESLASAIDYAHSLGFAVNLNVHLESYDSQWRANINPGDRSVWFTNYGLVLNHYALLAQKHNVEMITLGAELIDMTSDNLNSTNTSNWLSLITTVRSLYSGKLTYDGNWGGGTWNDELDHVKFWSALDYIGVSAYYHIGGSTPNSYSPDSLAQAWDTVNKSQLALLNQKYGKPILFTEVGYRNVDGALTHPASWEMAGASDMQEQSDGYQSLFAYWDKIPYFSGVQFWDWKSDPNAGGPNDTDFTVQGKTALRTITNWFTNNSNSQSTPQTNGPGTTTYLSDLAWVSATNGWGPVEKDMSNGEQTSLDGHRITINGKTYDKGLGTNAKSKIIFNISDCTNFTTDIGVDDEVTAKGSVVFQVWSGQHKIYDSGLMTYADNAKTVTLDITGATSLSLIVNDGGNGNGHDHADWANSQITCFSQPTVTPVPEPPNPPPPPNPTLSQPPALNAIIDVWWPADGSIISGRQPFKALVENLDISQYSMNWQVDNGPPGAMSDSMMDWPHKESLVDVSAWNSNSSGPYAITFVAKDLSGNIIASKTVNVTIWR